MIRSFKRKVVSVNAIQFKDDSQCLCDISDWVGGIKVSYDDPNNPRLRIESSGAIANVGDFIVFSPTGDFISISKELFLQKYDEIK